MANLVSWSSIELLHNVVRYFNILKENTGTSIPCLHYKAKVKLHGTNCAVQIHTTSEGVEVLAQGRTQMLSTVEDYKGFAKWVDGYKAFWASLAPASGESIVVFGEWCGPGVEPGMAISEMSCKVFAVFAIQVGMGEAAQVIYEPTELGARLKVGSPVNLFVLPWEGEELRVDFNDRASLDAAALNLNARVEAVENEDPWVKAVFGISGLGEGIVLYPVAYEGGEVPLEPEAYSHLMFKAKGGKHRNTRVKDAVQVEATVVASVGGFVDLMVTEARLQQGRVTACGGEKNPKFTGKFIAWVTADVKKESEAELAASGLTWAQVEKVVSARAREWFLAR